MTYKDFKARVRAIEGELFRPTQMHPILFALERADFEEQKLNKLIATARLANFATAKNRLAAWRRQLGRVQARKIRLAQFGGGSTAPPNNAITALPKLAVLSPK